HRLFDYGPRSATRLRNTNHRLPQTGGAGRDFRRAPDRPLAGSSGLDRTRQGPGTCPGHQLDLPVLTANPFFPAAGALAEKAASAANVFLTNSSSEERECRVRPVRACRTAW